MSETSDTPDSETETPAEAEETFLRDIDLDDVDNVLEMELTLFTQKDAELTERQGNWQTAALVWLLSKTTDRDEAAKAIDEGVWKEKVDAFRRTPEALYGLPEVVPAVAKMHKYLNRSGFLDDDGKKKG